LLFWFLDSKKSGLKLELKRLSNPFVLKKKKEREKPSFLVVKISESSTLES
jgi:hypothetical protein